jgi:hypothetical protein
MAMAMIIKMKESWRYFLPPREPAAGKGEINAVNIQLGAWCRALCRSPLERSGADMGEIASAVADYRITRWNTN